MSKNVRDGVNFDVDSRFARKSEVRLLASVRVTFRRECVSACWKKGAWRCDSGSLPLPGNNVDEIVRMDQCATCSLHKSSFVPDGKILVLRRCRGSRPRGPAPITSRGGTHGERGLCIISSVVYSIDIELELCDYIMFK